MSNLSAALEKAGDFLEAVEASSKAVTLNPNLLALQHNHAHILTRLGRFKDAEATYEKILTNQDTPDVSLSSYYYNQLFTDEPLTQEKINKNKRYGILFTEKFNPAEIARVLQAIVLCESDFCRAILNATRVPSSLNRFSNTIQEPLSRSASPP